MTTTTPVSLPQAYSMTAFARSAQTTEAYQFSWELRSVNQRYLDIQLRLPEAFRSLEEPLRDRVKKQLYRGKIDIVLQLTTTEQSRLTINNEALNELVTAINQVQQTCIEATKVNPLEILQWPGIMQTTPQTSAEKTLNTALIEHFDKALSQLVTQRQHEGTALAQLIEARCQSISQFLAALKPQLQPLLDAHTQKMRQRIADLYTEEPTPSEASRFHQEVAIMAQKADITEEIDRIETHLKAVHNLLHPAQNSAQPIGRKLDFLMQELNREANTLGSKSIANAISASSVELKVLIEQMREQIQNIE